MTLYVKKNVQVTGRLVESNSGFPEGYL
jgi:hypothetical protein